MKNMDLFLEHLACEHIPTLKTNTKKTGVLSYFSAIENKYNDEQLKYYADKFAKYATDESAYANFKYKYIVSDEGSSFFYEHSELLEDIVDIDEDFAFIGELVIYEYNNPVKMLFGKVSEEEYASIGKCLLGLLASSFDACL